MCGLKKTNLSMSSSYRDSLNKWLSQLEVSANSVLDIGGSQEQVKNRVKSWNVNEYLIGDLPNPHKDSIKPDIEMDLNSPIWSIEKTFDIIFCLEVFEYIYNPLAALSRVESYMNENGVAWVSFPSIYPMHEPINDDCLRYMPGGIKKLAEHARLNIAEMIPRRPETRTLLDFYSHERLRAAKNQDHMFMGWIVKFSK